MLNKKSVLIYIVLLLILCIIILQIHKIEMEVFDQNSGARVTLTKKSDVQKMYKNNEQLFYQLQQFIDAKYEEYQFKSIYLPTDYSKDTINEYDIFPRDNSNISDLVNELRTNTDIIKLSTELKINYIEIIDLNEDRFFLYLQKNVLDNKKFGLAYSETQNRYKDSSYIEYINDNWYFWYTKDSNYTKFQRLYDVIYNRINMIKWGV